MLELELHDDLARFSAAVTPWLNEHEAENALLLGLLGVLPASSIMLRATDAGRTVFVAFDGGRNLIISRGPDEAIDATAASLSALSIDLPGVVGPVHAAERFALAWAQARRCEPILAVEQRIYQLTEVVPPPPVPGAMRPVAVANEELVTAWAVAFGAEALPLSDRHAADAARDVVIRRTRAGELFAWVVDDQLVAMAGLARPTTRTITVNFVYTPPAHRRRGYATALVAAISAEGLRRGKEACALYTDLANPTSNSIYQKIGYRPVCDSRQYAFRGRS
jgi:GNAT superfamily N-acetyltransferase